MFLIAAAAGRERLPALRLGSRSASGSMGAMPMWSVRSLRSRRAFASSLRFVDRRLRGEIEACQVADKRKAGKPDAQRRRPSPPPLYRQLDFVVWAAFPRFRE